MRSNPTVSGTLNIRLWRNHSTPSRRGCLGWRDLGRDLRPHLGDRAQCTCEHKSGREQAPDSRSLELLNKVVAHLFVLDFSVLFHRLLTVKFVQTHITSSMALCCTTSYKSKWPYI